MTPQEQAHVFAAMLCCGACLGMIYDLLGPLRRITGLCAGADLLFGTVCAAGIVAVALNMQCEAFRLYVFVGVGLGLALYGLTIGAMIRRFITFWGMHVQKNREKCRNRTTAAGN